MARTEIMEEEQTQGTPAPNGVGSPLPPETDPYEDAIKQFAESGGLDRAHPKVGGFWDRLKNGAPGKSRTKEIARSLPRGVADMGAGLLNAGASVLDAVGADKAAENVRSSVKKDQQDIDQKFGRRSEDPIASFVESATEFTTGYILTSPLGVGKAVAGLGKGAFVAEGAIRGAIVDFTADPEGEQLAELAARAPVPVVKQIGEILSIDGDDSEIVKRLKRSAAGIVPGVALDAMVWGARALRASRAVARGVEGAEADLKAAQSVLDDISKGTHVPEGAHVKVEQDGDDFVIREVNAPKREGEIELDAEELADDAPRFADRAEAEAQAETINAAMETRLAVHRQRGGLTPEEAANARAFLADLASKKDVKEIARTIEERGVEGFDFSPHADVEDHLKRIEELAAVFEKEIQTVHNGLAPGNKVAVERWKQMANGLLEGLDEHEMPRIMGAVLEQGNLNAAAAKQIAANLALSNLGQRVAKMWDVLEARPHDLIAHEEARHAILSHMALNRELQRSGSKLGAGLRARQEFLTTGAEAGVKEVKVEKAAAKAAAKAEADLSETIAGMSQREIRDVSRMYKMAGGKPRDAFAVGHAVHIVKATGSWPKAIEFFVNSLLSGPKTAITAITSNTLTSAFESMGRVVAGVGTLNGKLAREGVDQLWSHATFALDNLKIAGRAARIGHSVINPTEISVAIGGHTGDALTLAQRAENVAGDVVRLPSRALLFGDEFTRVANYRAYVRAKSLRYWREKGLDGKALAAQVEGDLRASFTKDGIATIPDALKFAEGPTLSSPLGNQTLGGGLQGFVNDHPTLKFVVPFVKTSVNIFRYVHQNTPGLNRFNAQAKAIFAQGGEEAAVLHAKSVMASGIYALGATMFLSGSLTGRGPTDPKLRAVWLGDPDKGGHQPYSVKIGGKWVSYRKTDPVGMPLGLMGDLMTAIQELGEDDTNEIELTDAAVAFVSSLTANLANKSYLLGLQNFFEAWSKGEPHAAKRWVSDLASGFVVPQAAQQLNNDPYFRDAETVIESIVAKAPGFSKNLSPRYNMFGEPMLKAPGYLNRSLNIFTTKSATEQEVYTALEELDKGFTQPPKNKLMGEKVDLLDREKFDNGTGVSPWDRMQELVRDPGDGEPSLRDALTEMVKSDDWKDASGGSTLYPGGVRWNMAASIIDSYQQRAMGTVLEEYPKLQEEIERLKQLRGASLEEGQAGIDRLLKGSK